MIVRGSGVASGLCDIVQSVVSWSSVFVRCYVARTLCLPVLDSTREGGDSA